MKARKVSFLVPDISSPSLGAALRLATNVSSRYDVEIVGPDLGPGVCSMYRDAFDYTVVSCPRLYRYPDFWWESGRLGRALTGDVIIAVKAFADTVPVALRERQRRGAGVIVYLDEWDAATYLQQGGMERLTSWARHAFHPLETIHHPRVERMIARADEVVSTTTSLQERFGGKIVHMGVDCDFFMPQPPEEVVALKREWGVETHRLIVFGGVVRPHKGVEQILEALLRLNGPDVHLLVAGPKTVHLEALMRDARYGHLVHCAGAPPEDPGDLNQRVHDRIPAYLDMADLVVLPSNDTLLAQSQMPCKVFEAMAMAKPIVASRVADLPLVLSNCGRIFQPGDIDELASHMAYVLEHPDEAKAMGSAARRSCLEKYSKAKSREALVDAIGGVLHRRGKQ